MTETKNWLQIEAGYPEMFSKLKTFVNKNGIEIDSMNKADFNRFVAENNFPKFLNIPDDFSFNTKNIETTFRGLNSFLHLNNKK